MFTAAALVSGSLLLSRLLGLIRVTVFAGIYATKPGYKEYLAAFRIPDLLFTIIAGGALASAFVPVFAGLLERKRDDEAWDVANTVLNTVLVMMVLLGTIAFIFAPELSRLLNPAAPTAQHPNRGFSSEQIAQTANLTRIMLVQPILLGLGGVFAAMQNSYQRFLLPALAPLVYNASIILGAWLFGSAFGVYAAAWAVVIGALLMFEIQIWGVSTEAWRLRWEFNWSLSEAREVVRLIVPRMIGLSAFQLTMIVTFQLASALSSTGYTSLNYAWTLVLFPVGAVGTAFGVAVFPTLSRQAAGAQLQQLERTVREGLRLILFLALPSMAGLFVIGTPIIQLLYAHGGWTPSATEATSIALRFYAFSVVPLATVEIGTRAFYAMRNTRTPVGYAVLGAVLDIVLCVGLFFLLGPSRAEGGIAAGTSIAVWIQIVLLLRSLNRTVPGLLDNAFRKAVTAMALGTIVMSICVFAALKIIERVSVGGTFAHAFLECLVTVCVGAAVYLAIAYLFRLPELERFTGALRRLGIGAR